MTLNPTMSSSHDAKHYYATLFPAESVFCLLQRTRLSPSNREFGIETLDGKFRRWKSCSSPADLRRLLVSSETGKLNIGAVYETSVSNRFKRDRSGEYTPMNDVGAELKFDIDLDDYTHLGAAKHDLMAGTSTGTRSLETSARNQFRLQEVFGRLLGAAGRASLGV